jgi:catechol 2,3-dioxygenase-like lactoylglutathione lyase family enzyme
MVKSRLWLCALSLAIAPMPASAQTGFANVVDHIHLAAPDQAKAVEWYHRHFGGETMKEGPDRLLFGETRIIFQRNEKPQPSPGSVLDHIGFRPLNVDSAVAAMKVKNIKVTAEPRPLTLPSGVSMRLAFIEGPEGVRIELVQR